MLLYCFVMYDNSINYSQNSVNFCNRLILLYLLLFQKQLILEYTLYLPFLPMEMGNFVLSSHTIFFVIFMFIYFCRTGLVIVSQIFQRSAFRLVWPAHSVNGIYTYFYKRIHVHFTRRRGWIDRKKILI